MMHYYQFNIGDYAKATRHLSNLEDLAYRRLMDIYYDTEKPLINDEKKLARLINMRENVAEIENVLSDFFVLTDEGYSQKRIAEEIEHYTSKADTARLNGKKGGRPKKADSNPEETEQEPRKTQSVILANPEETGSKANQEPRTNNQEPRTNNQVINDGKKTPSINKFNDDDLKFAECFYEELLKIHPNYKKPKLESKGWADSVRLMRERDGRTYEEMIDMCKWVFTDGFWYKVIQSPEKLRSQWDKLMLQRGENKNVSSPKWDNQNKLGQDFESMFTEGEFN